MTTATGQAATFRVGLVQMRSARTPAVNVDTAVKLIGEAKSGGADYVLTPEMTNILELKRENLFAARRQFSCFLFGQEKTILLGEEKSGSNGIDPDVRRILLRHVHGEPLREIRHGCLRRGICGDARQRTKRIH